MTTTPRYRIGNDMTVLWAINNRDGSPYDMSGKEVRLFMTHRYGREEVACSVVRLPDGSVNNVIRWDFSGDDQKVLGPYALTVRIYTAEDMKLIRKDICEAFELVAVSCMECEEGGDAVINDGGDLILSSKLDIYRFGIPKIYIGSNGNWFIDGVDTGRSALGGGPGLVSRIYGKSDFGGTFDEGSVVDTFNAHAINDLAQRVAFMEGDDYLRLSNMTDVFFQGDLNDKDVLLFDGTYWTNVPLSEIGIGSGGSGSGADYDALSRRIAVFEKMFYWFEDDETIGTKYSFFSEQQVGAGGIGEPETGGIIDEEMSDTSDNAVANRVIKAYVDSADAEIKIRLNALEKDGSVFKFEFDSATNKATAEMVAAFAEAIASNKLIFCNGRVYKFILEDGGMYCLVSDAYMDITDGKLKASILAVTASSYDVQLMEEEVPVGTEITEATIRNWGFTKNAGTITGIKMNGETKGTSGVVDLGNVLTEHQKLKTINNQSIVGEGNIEIQSGSATPRVEMTAASAVIEPNKFYVWPMMDSLDLTLGAEQTGVMNRYLFQFRCPKEPLTILSLPAEVMWSEDVELDDNGLPVMDATAYYRVEIVENLATLKKWKLAYMQFADAEVERVLSEAVGDELGVPVNVVKNLKSFGAWLRGNTAAMTFHEFEQFKKVETIEQNAFNGCTNLALTFPPNVKVIGTAAFSDADAFAETLELPALEELGDYVFRLTNLKKVENLGNIEVLPANNSSTTSATFGGCTSLTFVRMPSSLKQLGSSVNPASPFRGCSALVNVICEAVTPPSMLVLAFEDCPSTLAIYVPDESVETYKGAMNWSHYMSRIRPVSDYELSAVIFTFKDAAVQAVMLANWDGNADGQLSKAEVQSITTLNRKFKGNATIVDCSDFDALTGLTYLLGGYNNGEFYNCTSLRFFAIPPNCKELQYYAFQKCTALESVTGLENVETMGLAVFDSCASLVINELRMPNLKGTLRANVFTATTMTRVEDLGAITHIAETGYNKGIFPKTLEFLRLPSTLTDITNFAFQINTNLQTVICEAVVPPTAAQGIFNGSNCPIYVPDASVEAYKAATTWSSYATRIKGISEYTG